MLWKFKCKFCCKFYVLKKELCFVWGKRCNLCGKMNYWKGLEMCEKRDKVYLVSYDFEFFDFDFDVVFVKMFNVFVNGVCFKNNELIYCEMYVNFKFIKL